MRKKKYELQTDDKLLNAFLAIINMGYPVATFAKLIERDSTTLYKWADGTRQISDEVRGEVKEKIKEMKSQWAAIEI